MTRVLSLVGLVLVASTAAADSGLDAIRARGQLIVAMKKEGASSPAAHKDPAHFQKRNFELEIARRLARQILGDKEKLVVKTLPGRDRLPALQAGEVDAVISMIRVDEYTRAVADLSEPYYESGLALLLPADSQVTKVEDLAGKRVGLPMQRENNPRERVDAVFAERKMNVEIVTYPEFRSAAKALEERRIDAMVSYDPNVEVYLAGHKADVRKYPELLTRDSFAVAVKKGETDLLQAVNEAIRSMKQSGELKDWADKWNLAVPGGSSSPQRH